MSTANQIEGDIVGYRHNQRKAEALRRLQNSSDYQLVVGEYLHDEAIRLVQCMYTCTDDPSLLVLNRKLSAISHFKGYLDQLILKGDAATVDILHAENELAEVRAGDL